MLPTTVELLREAKFLEAQAVRTTPEASLRDEVLKRAFVRSVEVIGEAAKKVTEATRSEFPAVEWKKRTGMRDRLIHDYGGVDYLIVWDVATHQAPELAVKLRPIIAAAR